MAPMLMKPVPGNLFRNVREGRLNSRPPFLEGCFDAAGFLEFRREVFRIIVHAA